MTKVNVGFNKEFAVKIKIEDLRDSAYTRRFDKVLLTKLRQTIYFLSKTVEN